MCSSATMEIANALCASFLSLFNVRRCLLRRAPSTLPASETLSFYTKSTTERHCYVLHRETHPNGHCFNGCHRESKETSLTKAVNCFILYSEPWRGPRNVGISLRIRPLSSHTLFRSCSGLRRGIHLSAAAPCLTNIMFLPGRIQQSVSVLKEKLVSPASFLWHPPGQKKLPGQCQGLLFCADVTFKSHCHRACNGVREDKSRLVSMERPPAWPSAQPLGSPVHLEVRLESEHFYKTCVHVLFVLR